jgi:hypothetical protein
MTFGHPLESELEWVSRYNAQLNQLPAQFAAARR